jgi:hypothetical protein
MAGCARPDLIAHNADNNARPAALVMNLFLETAELSWVLGKQADGC